MPIQQAQDMSRHTPFITRFTCLTTALLLSACGDNSSGGSQDTDDGIGSISQSGTDSADTSASAGPASNTQGGTADESSGGPDLNCGEVEVQLEASPGRVMLVLDKSYSMVIEDNEWDHDDDPSTDPVTRWYSLHAVVDEITSSFDSTIDFGMLLYPSMNAVAAWNYSACVVEDQPEVPVGPMNGQAIMAAMPGPNDTHLIHGGTPSRVAIEVALEHLLTFDAAIPRAILYVTDGEANCNPDYKDAQTLEENNLLFNEYDQGVHTVVADAWTSLEIPTYVVGIAIRNQVLNTAGTPMGINPHEKLNELAEDGGAPLGGATKYYRTDNQLELAAALEQIAAEQVSCVVELNPPPEYPEYVEVDINGQDVPKVDDCATEDGWVFHEPDENGVYTHIELCGTACDQLLAAGGIDATYGCPPSG
jgi:hypothetical protein